jgi:hypothetical protein
MMGRAGIQAAYDRRQKKSWNRRKKKIHLVQREKRKAELKASASTAGNTVEQKQPPQAVYISSGEEEGGFTLGNRRPSTPSGSSSPDLRAGFSHSSTSGSADSSELEEESSDDSSSSIEIVRSIRKGQPTRRAAVAKPSRLLDLIHAPASAIDSSDDEHNSAEQSPVTLAVGAGRKNRPAGPSPATMLSTPVVSTAAGSTAPYPASALQTPGSGKQRARTAGGQDGPEEYLTLASNKPAKKVKRDPESALPVPPPPPPMPVFLADAEDEEGGDGGDIHVPGLGEHDFLFNAEMPVRRKLVPDPKVRPAWWAGKLCPPNLHEEILCLCEYLSPTAAELKMRSDTQTRVSRVVTTKWPHAHVELFGSSRSGLFLPVSDIDLVVLRHNATPRELHVLASCLRSSGISTNLQVISRATVPIIKFQDSKTHCAIDISLAAGNGPENTAVVMDFLKRMPAAKPVILLVKFFLQQRGLNEAYRGGLSSYAVTLSVISYLQTQCRKAEWQLAQADLGRVLLGYFEFFGRRFNPYRTAISVRGDGYFFPKPRPRLGPSHHTASLLHIEDPHDPSNDVARSAFQTEAVLSAFREAHESLTQAVEAVRTAIPAFRRPPGRSAGETLDRAALPPVLDHLLQVPADMLQLRTRASNIYGAKRK